MTSVTSEAATQATHIHASQPHQLTGRPSGLALLAQHPGLQVGAATTSVLRTNACLRSSIQGTLQDICTSSGNTATHAAVPEVVLRPELSMYGCKRRPPPAGIDSVCGEDSIRMHDLPEQSSC